MRHSRLIQTVLLSMLLIVVAACSSQVESTPSQDTAPPDTTTGLDTETPEESPVEGTDGEYTHENFSAANFDRPTEITNQWLPLTPGMQYIFEGETEESGITSQHQVIFTVTDLTKVIDEVRSV